MTLSNLITAYREEHGLSQRQMGAQCGLSTGYISLIEKEINPQTGKPMVPTLAVLNKIAHGMNMSIDNLISLCDDMPIDLGPPAKASGPGAVSDAEAALQQRFLVLFRQLTPSEQDVVIAFIQNLISLREHPPCSKQDH